MVAATLPPRWSVGSRSSSLVNASPRRRAQSKPSLEGLPTSPAWALVDPSRPRRGEASALTILSMIAPVTVGTV